MWTKFTSTGLFSNPEKIKNLKIIFVIKMVLVSNRKSRNFKKLANFKTVKFSNFLYFKGSFNSDGGEMGHYSLWKKCPPRSPFKFSK